MRRRQVVLITAAALMAAACFDGGDSDLTPAAVRAQRIEDGLALAVSDPGHAATLLESAGPGAWNERLRVATWAACLKRSGGSIDAWSRLLAEAPPQDVAEDARLAMIRLSIASGSFEDAEAFRAALPETRRSKADQVLLAANDPDVRDRAARRLAMADPGYLRSVDPALDARIAATLDESEILRRSAAWREGGKPVQAGSELRGLRWRGDNEAVRRRELARAELAAGSPIAALRALPSGNDATVEDLVLRAEAYLRRAWQRFPDRRATSSFQSCAAAADDAIDRAAEPDNAIAAHAIRLECATEAGALDAALASWRALQRVHWEDSRRAWLARRLAVALAVDGASVDPVFEIAASLPYHRRCLTYWATRRSGDQSALAALTTADVADIYGQWAREALAMPSPEAIELVPGVGDVEPWARIRRLLEGPSVDDALNEWRRIRSLRMLAPGEAVAAAAVARDAQMVNDAIRWIRSGFPELGTVDLRWTPEEAIIAYLPFEWRAAVVGVGREFGVEPWVVAAVARQESVFTAHARSPRGAVGLLQLRPTTARGHARALGLGASPDLLDAELNLRLGTRELGYLIRRFGAIEPALAAYNAGETRTRGWWRRWPDRQRFTEAIPIPETYNYVRRVLYLAEAYRLVYADVWREQR